MLHPRFLIMSLLVGLPVSAQGTKILPAFAASADANAESHFPFGLDAGRMQELVEGSSIAVASATLTSFAYRKDTAQRTWYTGRIIKQLKLSLGHSSKTPATMSRNFAANRTGTQTQVFAGAYNLPPQAPPVSGPGKWNIVLKPNNPFQFQRSLGNLLIEIEIPGLVNKRFLYSLDAHKGSKGGSMRSFGPRGVFASKDAYAFAGSDAYLLHPDGRARLDLVGLMKAYPTVLGIGLSDSQFGSLTLPFDLKPLGAPGNSLLVSLEILAPVALTKRGSLYEARLSLPIPKVAIPAGTKVFAQMLFVDQPSNTLGLVLSGGVEMTIAPRVGTPIQALGAVNSAAATGNYVLGTSVIGGPVIQLAGSFN
ncbi:MAG: hypothetical protein ACE5F1_04900 [Planctomycetota bacterium]